MLNVGPAGAEALDLESAADDLEAPSCDLDELIQTTAQALTTRAA